MKSEKGQSLVEFALVLPVLIMLLFGIIDFSNYFYKSLTIDHAGREAARAASIGQSEGDVKLVAQKQSFNDIGVVVNFVPTSDSEKEAKITITYSVKLLTPGVGSLVGTIPITNTTVMRVE